LPQFLLPTVPSSAGASPGSGGAGSGLAEPAATSGADRAQSSASQAGGHGSERERLIEAMEKAGWVQAKAARLLGLTPRQIGYALKKYGIEIRHF
jgi:Nif-specific regulatory protein